MKYGAFLALFLGHTLRECQGSAPATSGMTAATVGTATLGTIPRLESVHPLV